MKESIGKVTPESQADQDHDGVADESEQVFAETSQRQPAAGEEDATPSHSGKPGASEDDEALESARTASSATMPGSSN